MDAYDPGSRASIPFLREGRVKLQTLAIFSETNERSVGSGTRQFQIYLDLPRKYPGIFGQEIKTIVSVENASNFCAEDDTLQEGLKRVDAWYAKTPIAYISLTWNSENRFGGGNASKVGLKPDGVELLKWMSGKKIAIDLSHTSDRLALDIFEAIDRYALKLTPVASHSNFRAVCDRPRNLTDEIAQEIGKRGGVIGLNFVRGFLKDFVSQVKHAEKLGLLDHYCFGADFFEDHSVPPELNYLLPFFLEGFDTAACYPKLIDLLQQHFATEVVEKIAYTNLSQFLGMA